MSIILYANHACPWCHRVYIALEELGLEFEEVIIDLNKPREPWYLEINPKGVVPSLKYNGKVLTESAIISSFLADLQPSHLLPTSGAPEAALFRARVSAFVGDFFSTFQPKLNATSAAPTPTEQRSNAEALVSAAKSLVPHLRDASPFFGGSSKPTLAEVLTGPFLVRTYSYAKEEVGLIPPEALEKLKEVEVWQRWAAAAVAAESIPRVYDEEVVVGREKAKRERARLARLARV